jgi:hypothetical protein
MHAIAMNLQNLWIMTAPIVAHLPWLRLRLIILDPLPARPTHRYARNNIRNILSPTSTLSDRTSPGRGTSPDSMKPARRNPE